MTDGFGATYIRFISTPYQKKFTIWLLLLMHLSAEQNQDEETILQKIRLYVDN